MLLAPAHHAGGGVQAKGAPARQYQRVDALDQMARLKGRQFTLANGSATDITRRNHAPFGKQHRAARQRAVILRVADLESRDRSKSLRHGKDNTSSNSDSIWLGFGAVTPSDSGQTWKEVVRQALAELGGQAHLRQINDIIKTHPKTLTNPTWKDTIRRVVRQYAIFQPVPPERSGIYRLVDQPAIEPEPASMTGRESVDHGIAQGMLLALGRLYGYETFAPSPDRTTREFGGRLLADLATVTDCSGFCAKTSLPRVRQIDVIWLAEDNEGTYPVYAFEVEHTTRVRSGIDRLVEIPDRYKAGLFVVAPGEKEQRIFSSLVTQNRFRRYRDRLCFRDYTQLESLYNSAVRHDDLRSSFGVFPRRT